MMLLAILPCAVFFGLAAMFFSEPLLALPDNGSRADVIVVPGGDGPPRAEQAARLWKEGRSPYILVTGDGDCLFNKQIMVQAGVPPSVILAECYSGSTWQNALYSVPMMREIHAKSALIVTNWYHSRRAVASFRAVCPQMHFMSAPVDDSDIHVGFPATRADAEHIAQEYIKLGWYLVSGRIFPQDLTGNSPALALSAICQPAEGDQ